jgi:hypothetical protein
MRSLFAPLGLVFALGFIGCSAGGGGPSAAVDAHGVGAPCQSSADCEAPLFCNSDPVNHLLDQQCTAACDSAQPCDTSLGSSAACILGDLCVRACASDADCPSGTACNSSRWCERIASPPASTNLHCVGTSLGCAAIKGTGANCSDVPGCSRNELCVGKPESCYSQGLGCGSVSGCEYDISLEGCTGEPSPCDLNSTYYYCGDVLGCSWDYECVGTPRPCELLTAAACEKQPGCFLQ